MNQDLMAALEQRWEAMAQTIKTLRGDNQALKEQVQEREEQIERLKDEVAQTRASLDALQGEKSLVIEKVENLLARFDTMAP